MRTLRSILSLAFVLLVLFSSTSFMVGIHHCGGHVKSIALFDKAEACAQERQMPPCHRMDTPPCCQDVTVIHEHQDFNTQVSSWDFQAAPIADAIVPVILLDEVIPSVAPYLPVAYNPPLPTADRVVALHVFLI
ncbi:MAG: hypothetical protein JNL40_07625 [Cyclobacteriaceae bacterium]|nr:hypothetical protein [Cyclobacteriaceae bacterium]